MIRNFDKAIKTGLAAVVVAGLLAGVAPSVLAAQKGSANEAVAMVKRAVNLIRTKGRESAFAQFNAPGGQFVDRDLYIAVLDSKGVMAAHGNNPRLIGKSLIDMRDAGGKAFIKELVDAAQRNGSGWVEYKWPNPVSGDIESKSTYVEKVDDLTVACGIYK
ncbi:cache domain-containing protein [Rugamonas apoptosis]|uniref:Cache domain-containing protein n=1 Tax=Rugamonas apoptosis TaxID=2758570 RepID=A0A7W2IMV5_9BURK|nr:cache domain-containing protein [Rugamonas apoptosis]MBA5689956.1 cache domain-containing protein [Rugamonas apoptosis]